MTLILKIYTFLYKTLILKNSINNLSYNKVFKMFKFV